jgi:hypothetical protein
VIDHPRRVLRNRDDPFQQGLQHGPLADLYVRSDGHARGDPEVCRHTMEIDAINRDAGLVIGFGVTRWDLDAVRRCRLLILTVETNEIRSETVWIIPSGIDRRRDARLSV